MSDISSQSSINKPVIYRIIVRGRLDASWTEWFDNLSISVARDQSGVVFTTLTGPVADQGALHGLLTRLRDLGLTLLEVHCLDPGNDSATEVG